MVLLTHRDVIFEDDVVLATGHAYFNCTFRRCTITIREGESFFHTCAFESCIWHIDMVIHDVQQLARFQNMIPLIESGLPRSDPTKVGP
jgi:hypothetical protein